jgi:hypothetical protein
MPSRRQFIKVGIAGGLLLAGVRFLDRPQAEAASSGFTFLDARSASAVAALVPVVLAGSLPANAAARAQAIQATVAAFDRAVAGLSAAVQKEVDELFSILRFGPARLMFTGLWSPLEEASPDDIAAFLGRWRHSRFDIQRAGYQAITQLLQAAWYGNPASWPGIGYPGAPQVAAR